MYFKATLIFALAVLGVSNAQVFGVGQCPSNVQVIQNFNLEKYLGTWYEFAKYPNRFEKNGKCITAVYSLEEDGNVGVTNSMIDIKTGEEGGIVGTATPVESGKLLVTFPVSTSTSSSSNYWVLDTDYTSYSIVYSCESVGRFAHITFAWILTRERKPDPKIAEIAQHVFSQNNLSYSEFKKTDQRDCN